MEKARLSLSIYFRVGTRPAHNAYFDLLKEILDGTYS